MSGKYHKILNVNVVDGQAPKIRNAINKKRGTTITVQQRQETDSSPPSKGLLLTKKQIYKISKANYGPVNIKMNATQLCHNHKFKGGFIGSLIAAAITAALAGAISGGVEKAVSGKGIGPPPSVCRHLLQRGDGDLTVHKNNRVYGIKKEGKGFYLNPRRYLGKYGNGFYLNPSSYSRKRSVSAIPIHPKTNSDTRQLSNIFF